MISNRWTWTNLANMLWVEQPIGVGHAKLIYVRNSAILNMSSIDWLLSRCTNHRGRRRACRTSRGISRAVPGYLQRIEGEQLLGHRREREHP